MERRAAGGGRAGGWAGWAERLHPIPCQALLLEWAKGHEGEWEGEALGCGLARRMGQGQRREKNKGVRMEEWAPADLWVPQSGASWTESPEWRAGPLWGGPGSEVSA